MHNVDNTCLCIVPIVSTSVKSPSIETNSNIAKCEAVRIISPITLSGNILSNLCCRIVITDLIWPDLPRLIPLLCTLSFIIVVRTLIHASAVLIFRSYFYTIHNSLTRFRFSQNIHASELFWQQILSSFHVSIYLLHYSQLCHLIIYIKYKLPSATRDFIITPI